MAHGIGRRAFLAGVGGSAGLLLAQGLGVRGFGQPRAASADQALRDLVATLTPGQRQRILLPWHHPSRQLTNTIAVIERPHLGTLLSPHQQVVARRLCDAMLSERGRADLANTFAVEGRFEGCTLVVYGEPGRGPAQASISGGHLHLRGGTPDPSGEPLGGAVSYGNQIGNGRWRIPGNSFAYHGDAANRFYAALAPAERARAVLPAPPHELVVQAQGAGARIPGVRLGSLGEAGREEGQRLVDTVLGLYPDERGRAARDAIDANGGIEALHVSFFESKGFHEEMVPWSELDPAERAQRGDPYWQVWRIEGPGTVMHFQGHPHVHAYVNVVRDPASANVGETLGETAGVSGESARRLLEAAMRRSSGERFAWHDAEVPGRFCPGVVTTGLAWSMDPYGNRIAVATLEERAMGRTLKERLAAGGAAPEPGRRYRVASTEWYVRDEEGFGKPERIEDTGVLLRDAVVDLLRAEGVAGWENALRWRSAPPA